MPSDLYTAISNVSTTVPYNTFTPQLGVRAVTGDGREFRYVQAGASALIVGQVQQSPALVANGTGTCPVLAIGALSAALTVSSSTYAANALAGGYFATYGTVANGGGQNIRISGNTAVTSGTTLTVTFDEPVPFAITASANFVLVPAKYNGVIQMPLPGEADNDGHCMVYAAYDDNTNQLSGPNSWGEDWGDKGWFYMGYDFVNTGIVSDCWTLRRVQE